eukprot:6139894-Amphidinium_carterae.1
MESGRLKWLLWERLTSKQAESVQTRVESHLVVDAMGAFRPKPQQGPDANLTSAAHIMCALKRRGVALDIAELIVFRSSRLSIVSHGGGVMTIHHAVTGILTVFIKRIKIDPIPPNQAWNNLAVHHIHCIWLTSQSQHTCTLL